MGVDGSVFGGTPLSVEVYDNKGPKKRTPIRDP